MTQKEVPIAFYCAPILNELSASTFLATRIKLSSLISNSYLRPVATVCCSYRHITAEFKQKIKLGSRTKGSRDCRICKKKHFDSPKMCGFPFLLLLFWKVAKSAMPFLYFVLRYVSAALKRVYWTSFSTIYFQWNSRLYLHNFIKAFFNYATYLRILNSEATRSFLYQI